jgi:hypothetical protein
MKIEEQHPARTRLSCPQQLLIIRDDTKNFNQRLSANFVFSKKKL